MNKKNLATCRCPSGKDCSWNVNLEDAECQPSRTSQASAQIASQSEPESADAGKNCGGLQMSDERQMPLGMWICDINGFRFRYTGNDDDITHNTKCAMKCSQGAEIINLKGPNVCCDISH